MAKFITNADPEKTPLSPHVLDLTKISNQKLTPNRKIADLKFPSKKVQNDYQEIIFYYEEHPALTYRPNRFREITRMVAMGIIVIFTLNGANILNNAFSFKNDLVSASYEDYSSLFTFQPDSQNLLQETANRFQAAQQSLWFLQSQRTQLITAGTAADSITQILRTGEILTREGAKFINFSKDLQPILAKLFTEQSSPRLSITEQISQIYSTDFKSGLAELNVANDQFQAINSAFFPKNIRSYLPFAKEKLNQLVEELNYFDQNFPLLLHLLGDDLPQTYLILLENTDEMRPGGGFIGSYLLATLNDGYLDELSFHDVYDLDGQFHEIIEPPLEIARLTSQWGLRDSNYSPDISISSAKAAWFFEKEGGQSVDQVITIDLEAVRALLQIIEPVTLNGFTNPITADNFRTLLSYAVESKLTGENSPKQILAQFIPRVLLNLRSQKPVAALLAILPNLATEKHLTAYSTDEKIQDFFRDLGVSGAIPKPKEHEDYFMVTSTSLGGNKSDAYLSQDIIHQTKIEKNGSILNQISLTREHHWNNETENELKKVLASYNFNSLENWLMAILGQGPNVSGIRVYVPKGSQLLQVEGILKDQVETKYDADLGLDYFYFQVITYPGDKTIVKLSYQLPFTLELKPLDEYRLTVVSQPGDHHTELTKEISADSRLTIYRSFPDDLTSLPGDKISKVYRSVTPLTHNLNFAQLWGK
ncbi:MAG: hypothetical protein UT55_C0054G0010 [Candidatus Peregrinibacteria bacterium GW2011_GWE2_39_6]|nr:MAG: hypothetical protein UT36_C0003G0099 [Candidatus Peregrinibacteria bacterium GW2011_GWF2_39_17]KKR24781.1 MAG: hypothetical protein UT55_C0054G0010 [Candidatus Peregrinibacteria bacterium GW2011_GWE2_39_6]HCW31939.1 hypothetical protein [Candidatus Peregrinibacteria bacterium]